MRKGRRRGKNRKDEGINGKWNPEEDIGCHSLTSSHSLWRCNRRRHESSPYPSPIKKDSLGLQGGGLLLCLSWSLLIPFSSIRIKESQLTTHELSTLQLTGRRDQLVRHMSTLVPLIPHQPIPPGRRQEDMAVWGWTCCRAFWWTISPSRGGRSGAAGRVPAEQTVGHTDISCLLRTRCGRPTGGQSDPTWPHWSASHVILQRIYWYNETQQRLATPPDN